MTTGYVGPNGQWVSVADTPNQSDVRMVTRTDSGVVSALPARVVGYVVTAAMSAAATTVYDNASSAAGTVLFVIPASKAVGEYVLPEVIPAAAGIYASFAGTGTVNFLFK